MPKGQNSFSKSLLNVKKRSLSAKTRKQHKTTLELMKEYSKKIDRAKTAKTRKQRISSAKKGKTPPEPMKEDSKKIIGRAKTAKTRKQYDANNHTTVLNRMVDYEKKNIFNRKFLQLERMLKQQNTNPTTINRENDNTAIITKNEVPITVSLNWVGWQGEWQLKCGEKTEYFKCQEKDIVQMYEKMLSWFYKNTPNKEEDKKKKEANKKTDKPGNTALSQYLRKIVNNLKEKKLFAFDFQNQIRKLEKGGIEVVCKIPKNKEYSKFLRLREDKNGYILSFFYEGVVQKRFTITNFNIKNFNNVNQISNELYHLLQECQKKTNNNNKLSRKRLGKQPKKEEKITAKKEENQPPIQSQIEEKQNQDQNKPINLEEQKQNDQQKDNNEPTNKKQDNDISDNLFVKAVNKIKLALHLMCDDEVLISQQEGNKAMIKIKDLSIEASWEKTQDNQYCMHLSCDQAKTDIKYSEEGFVDSVATFVNNLLNKNKQEHNTKWFQNLIQEICQNLTEQYKTTVSLNMVQYEAQIELKDVVISVTLQEDGNNKQQCILKCGKQTATVKDSEVKKMYKQMVEWINSPNTTKKPEDKSQEKENEQSHEENNPNELEENQKGNQNNEYPSQLQQKDEGKSENSNNIDNKNSEDKKSGGEQLETFSQKKDGEHSQEQEEDKEKEVENSILEPNNHKDAENLLKKATNVTQAYKSYIENYKKENEEMEDAQKVKYEIIYCEHLQKLLAGKNEKNIREYVIEKIISYSGKKKLEENKTTKLTGIYVKKSHLKEVLKDYYGVDDQSSQNLDAKKYGRLLKLVEKVYDDKNQEDELELEEVVGAISSDIQIIKESPEKIKSIVLPEVQSQESLPKEHILTEFELMMVVEGNNDFNIKNKFKAKYKKGWENIPINYSELRSLLSNTFCFPKEGCINPEELEKHTKLLITKNKDRAVDRIKKIVEDVNSCLKGDKKTITLEDVCWWHSKSFNIGNDGTYNITQTIKKSYAQKLKPQHETLSTLFNKNDDILFKLREVYTGLQEQREKLINLKLSENYKRIKEDYYWRQCGVEQKVNELFTYQKEVNNYVLCEFANILAREDQIVALIRKISDYLCELFKHINDKISQNFQSSIDYDKEINEIIEQYKKQISPSKLSMDIDNDKQSEKVLSYEDDLAAIINYEKQQKDKFCQTQLTEITASVNELNQKIDTIYNKHEAQQKRKKNELHEQERKDYTDWENKELFDDIYDFNNLHLMNKSLDILQNQFKQEIEKMKKNEIVAKEKTLLEEISDNIFKSKKYAKDDISSLKEKLAKHMAKEFQNIETELQDNLNETLKQLDGDKKIDEKSLMALKKVSLPTIESSDSILNMELYMIDCEAKLDEIKGMLRKYSLTVNDDLIKSLASTINNWKSIWESMNNIQRVSSKYEEIVGKKQDYLYGYQKDETDKKKQHPMQKIHDWTKNKIKSLFEINSKDEMILPYGLDSRLCYNERSDTVLYMFIYLYEKCNGRTDFISSAWKNFESKAPDKTEKETDDEWMGRWYDQIRNSNSSMSTITSLYLSLIKREKEEEKLTDARRTMLQKINEKRHKKLATIEKYIGELQGTRQKIRDLLQKTQPTKANNTLEQKDLSKESGTNQLTTKIEKAKLILDEKIIDLNSKIEKNYNVIKQKKRLTTQNPEEKPMIKKENKISEVEQNIANISKSIKVQEDEAKQIQTQQEALEHFSQNVSTLSAWRDKITEQINELIKQRQYIYTIEHEYSKNIISDDELLNIKNSLEEIKLTPLNDDKLKQITEVWSIVNEILKNEKLKEPDLLNEKSNENEKNAENEEYGDFELSMENKNDSIYNYENKSINSKNLQYSQEDVNDQNNNLPIQLG